MTKAKRIKKLFELWKKSDDEIRQLSREIEWEEYLWLVNTSSQYGVCVEKLFETHGDQQ